MAAPAPSRAAEQDEGEEKGRFKLGPLYLTPKIMLRSAGVDSNVFNSETAPVSDTSVVLTPSLDALLPVGQRLRFKGTGGLGLNYFQRERSERSTDLFASGRAELDIGPVTLFGGGGGSRGKQRFSTEIDRRLERLENHLNVGAIFNFTGKIALTASGGRQVQTYESGVVAGGDDVKESLDKHGLTGMVQLRYALTNKTGLLASAEILDDEFVSQKEEGPNKARSYRYLGGFEFSTGALLQGALLAGYREFPSSPTQAAPPFRGPTVSVNLSGPFFGRGALGLLASRDVRYSVTRVQVGDQQLRNSYVSSQYGGNLSLELPWSLIARGSIVFQRASYLLPYQDSEGAIDRLDRVRTTGVSLLRAFGQSLRIGATYEWQQRESNLEGFGYRRQSYGLTAEVTP